MATEELHLIYRRSGGFAGIVMAAECLGADLPEDQARVATDLLGATTEAEGGERASPPPPGPGADQFSYTVRIRQGARSRTLTWSDSTVPELARPLLSTLGALAQPTRAT
ncbi:protealysin inhibitor emfourin [Pedococcus sp. KACC 23699]|uniref:Protealysin inhibitor emfourin n=1 Tax=Pedococcus sp. KACC 23699 TaxID=3149228 RepID=A0AAU7JVM4_9MICO